MKGNNSVIPMISLATYMYAQELKFIPTDAVAPMEQYVVESVVDENRVLYRYFFCIELVVYRIIILVITYIKDTNSSGLVC